MIPLIYLMTFVSFYQFPPSSDHSRLSWHPYNNCLNQHPVAIPLNLGLSISIPPNSILLQLNTSNTQNSSKINLLDSESRRGSQYVSSGILINSSTSSNRKDDAQRSNGGSEISSPEAIPNKILSGHAQDYTIKVDGNHGGLDDVMAKNQLGDTRVALLNGLSLHFNVFGVCTNIDQVLPTGLSLNGVIFDNPFNPSNTVRYTHKYEIKLKIGTADLMLASNEEFVLPSDDILRIDASGIPSINQSTPTLPTYRWDTLPFDLEELTKCNALADQRLPQEVIVRIFRALLQRFGEKENRKNEVSAICLGLTSKRNWRTLHVLVKSDSMVGPIWLRMPHELSEERSLAFLLNTWMGDKYRHVNQEARYEAEVHTYHQNRKPYDFSMPTLFLSRSIYGDESYRGGKEARLIARYTDCRIIIDAAKTKLRHPPLLFGYDFQYLQLPNPFGMGESWYAAAAKAVLDDFGWREWDGQWYGSNRAHAGPKYKKFMSWRSFRDSSLFEWVLAHAPGSEKNFNATTRFVREKLRDIDCTFMMARDPTFPVPVWNLKERGS